MSTATARTAGDNEFPVLLRLPDLNAPVWPAKGIIAPAPVLVPSAESAAPKQAAKAATELTPPTDISTVTVREASTTNVAAATSASPATESSTDSTTVTTSITTPEGTRTSVATTMHAATQTAAQAARHAQRVTREVLTEPRFKMLRQFAGGGMLVGGLALTYLVIMGGDSKTPDHITQAETTLEPPVIDIAGPGEGPVILSPDNTPTDIANVPAPPAMDRSWELPENPVMPTHIEVAELTPRGSNAPPTGDRYPPETHGTYRPEVREEVPGDFKGRIGPGAGPVIAPERPPLTGAPYPNTAPDFKPNPQPKVVLPSIEGRTYPVTDQANFEFRPPTFPRDSGRVDTARRNPASLPPR